MQHEIMSEGEWSYLRQAAIDAICGDCLGGKTELVQDLILQVDAARHILSQWRRWYEEFHPYMIRQQLEELTNRAFQDKCHD